MAMVKKDPDYEINQRLKELTEKSKKLDLTQITPEFIKINKEIHQLLLKRKNNYGIKYKREFNIKGVLIWQYPNMKKKERKPDPDLPKVIVVDELTNFKRSWFSSK